MTIPGPGLWLAQFSPAATVSHLRRMAHRVAHRFDAPIGRTYLKRQGGAGGMLERNMVNVNNLCLSMEI